MESMEIRFDRIGKVMIGRFIFKKELMEVSMGNGGYQRRDTMPSVCRKKSGCAGEVIGPDAQGQVS